MAAGGLDGTLTMNSLAGMGAGQAATSDRVGERALITACQQGDAAAFETLVERHQRDIFRLCQRLARRPEDAADLTQEVFLRAFRAIGRFRGDSAFATWLFRIALNTCRSFHSARRPATEELREDAVVVQPDFAARLDRAERARLVRDAVAELPDKQRATLVLKIYHELTHEQIAGTLGTSVGTAKANLFHALVNLRRLLAARGVTPGDVR
jgi:RNA polymerase sigma-70 factor (ECF subfamily)